MNLEVSGFFAPADIYDVSKERLTLIHSSEEGFYELYRGERAGHFRAFKCLKPEFRGNLLQETMLQKEFEIGFSLKHPGIRETYSYTQVDSLGNCIEMEWIDGCTLDEYLHNATPDEGSFRRMAEELCDAVANMHAHQIIHRDIKPSNIMVTHQGKFLKLIDFSLADSSSHTLLKQPAGTMGYAAPEVLAGQDANQRSDIYSLGKVLSRMTPRHRKALAKCMDANPSGRYDSAEQLKDSLLRRPTLWPWIAAVPLVAGIAWFALQAPEAVPAPQMPEMPEITETPETEMTVPPASAKKPQEQSGNKNVNAHDIDAIFNEASDLFK